MIGQKALQLSSQLPVIFRSIIIILFKLRVDVSLQKIILRLQNVISNLKSNKFFVLIEGRLCLTIPQFYLLFYAMLPVYHVK